MKKYIVSIVLLIFSSLLYAVETEKDESNLTRKEQEEERIT